MSSSVESRILTMKFENSQFLSGVSTVLSALDKLRSGLGNLGSSKKGMDELNASAKNFNMGNVGGAVDGISAKFAAMATVGITALANITNRAVDAGLQMANSLTLAPLKAGFDEYELKMGSIQTILSNTARYGTSLETVTAKLDELNEYADKTIYNFGDMTKNIGLFTNSGLRIGEATSMIKGFSNEAAASGTNAQGAASAAYQLSQALANGEIRLMDWKSLTNVGMGNANMKNGLIELADAMGTIDAAGTSAEEVTGNFNGTLEKGWLSSDVMSKYLQIMAGDMTKAEMAAMGLDKAQIDMFTTQQKNAEDAATKVRTFSQLIGTIRESIGSGWAETFGIVFGDFNEATELFTGLNNVIGGAFGAMSDRRNELLTEWSDLGGRTALIEGLGNAFKALGNILRPIGEAFRDVFPPATGEKLYELTVGFREFTEGLLRGSEKIEGIGAIFRLVFGAIGVIIDVAQGAFQYFIVDALSLIGRALPGVINFIGSIADVVAKFVEWIDLGDRIQGVFEFLSAGRERLLGPIIDGFSDLLTKAGGFVELGFGRIIEFFESLAPLGDKLQDLGVRLQGIAESGFNQFLDEMRGHWEKIEPYVVRVGEAFSDAFDKLQNFLGGADFSGMVDSFSSLVASGAGEFVAGLVAGISALGPILSDLGGSMEAAFGKLGEMLGGVSGFNLGSIFDFGPSAEAAASGIQKVNDAVGGSEGVADRVGSAWDRIVEIFKGIGEWLAPVWDGITNLFSSLKDMVMGFVEGMGMEDALALVNTGLFMAVYLAIRGFVGQMKNVAKATAGTMESIGGTFDQLSSNLKTMQSDVKANMILKIAIAIGILAVSLFLLSKIDPVKLGTALAAVGLMLFMLVKALERVEAMAKDTGKEAARSAANMIVMSVGLIALGTALLLFAGAVAILGRMSLEDLAKGLGAVAITLGILVVAADRLAKSGGGGQLIAMAIALGIISISLVAFAGALKLYASINTDTMVDGGLKVAATLGAIALIMRMMPPNMLASAAALIITATALTIMAGVMKIFGGMSIEEMAKSLIMLGGAMLILVVGMNAMTAGLAGAAALFIVAAALRMLAPVLVQFGQMSLGEIATALGVLAGVFVVLGLAGLILAPIVPVLLILGAAVALLGVGALAAGAGMLMFAAGLTAMVAIGAAGFAVLTGAVIAFAELLPLVMQQFGLGIIAFAKVIAESGPPLVQAFTTVLISLLRAVRKATPELAKTLRVMLTHGLAVMRTFIPQFIKFAFDMLNKFMRELERNIPKIADKGTDIMVAFLKAIGDNFPRLVDQGGKTIVKVLNGIAQGIRTHSKEISDAGWDIADAIVDGMAEGLRGGVDRVIAAAKALADNLPWPVKKALEILSPSRVMRRLGAYASEGFAIGVGDHNDDVARRSGDLASTALDTMSVIMSKIGDEMAMNSDFQPTIAPVLDLTQLQNDATRIGTLFDNPSIQAGASYAGAATVSAEQLAALEASLVDVDAGTKREVVFEQTLISPEPLSPVRVYRDTRSLLSIAKEALA